MAEANAGHGGTRHYGNSAYPLSLHSDPPRIGDGEEVGSRTTGHQSRGGAQHGIGDELKEVRRRVVKRTAEHHRARVPSPSSSSDSEGSADSGFTSSTGRPKGLSSRDALRQQELENQRDNQRAKNKKERNRHEEEMKRLDNQKAGMGMIILVVLLIVILFRKQ